MSERSRRSFLKSGSIGAAAGGVALTPGLFGAAATAATGTGPSPAGPLPAGPVTAYIKDHTTGDISVMVGEREVVYRDHYLAARLASIATHARPV